MGYLPYAHVYDGAARVAALLTDRGVAGADRVAATEAGINAAAVEHLSHLWRFLRTRPPEYQAWYQTTDTFERLTGQTPQSLAQFLHEDKDLLAGVAAR